MRGGGHGGDISSLVLTKRKGPHVGKAKQLQLLPTNTRDRSQAGRRQTEGLASLLLSYTAPLVWHSGSLLWKEKQSLAPRRV